VKKSYEMRKTCAWNPYSEPFGTEEKRIFGVGVEDGVIMRDVPQVADILGNPEGYLTAEPLRLRLTDMGIKISGSSSALGHFRSDVHDGIERRLANSG